MKNLFNYITESSNGYLTQEDLEKIWSNLLIDDRERIVDVNRLVSKPNVFASAEDIEQAFWKGSYKNRVDDYFGYVTEWLQYIKRTPKEIADAYSFSRVGKQMKIEVIAQVIRSLIPFAC